MHDGDVTEERCSSPTGFKEATVVAQRLLARRNHSVQELRSKLLLRGFDEHAVQMALDHCLAQRWLDDVRFAALYIEYRAQRGFGPLKIEQALLAKGVDKLTINLSLRQTVIVWPDLLARTFEKKFKEIGPPYSKLRFQQQRFLQYRGFLAEDINHYFENHGL